MTEENDFYKIMWDQKARGEIIKHNNPLVAVDELEKQLTEELTAYVTTGQMSTALLDTLTTGNFATIVTKDFIASMNLIVGQEITMGPNATIQWAKVLGTPTIPTTAAQVGALATTWVGATYIDANGLYTGTINANKINVGTLNGFSITGASITGGTITGTTVQTAASGARLVLNGTNLSGYNSSGYVTSQLDGNALTFYNSGTLVGSLKGSYNAMQIDMPSSGQFVITVGGSNALVYYNNEWSFFGTTYIDGGAAVASQDWVTNAGVAYSAKGLTGTSTISCGSTGCTINPNGGTLRLGNSSGAYLQVVGQSLVFTKSGGASTTLVA
jgi:hypothetical protein